jgi:hypothetical protein
MSAGNKTNVDQMLMVHENPYLALNGKRMQADRRLYTMNPDGDCVPQESPLPAAIGGLVYERKERLRINARPV